MMLCPLLVSFFASLTFAANWQYEIYVSSSFGVNTNSCWNGGDQTPCATLSLALQGLQHNSTVIYLYPGTYILDNTSKVIDKSNIAIIGLTTKDGGKTVTIKCSSHSGLLFLSSINITLKFLVLDSCGNIQINPNREFDFQVSAVYISMCYNVQLIDIVIKSGNNSTGCNQHSSNEYGNRLSIANGMLECPYLKLKKSPCDYHNYNPDNNITSSGVPFYICALTYDCINKTFYWRYNLRACIVSGPASFYSNQQCDTIYWVGNFMITLFNTSTINSNEVILSIQTNLSTVQMLESNLSIILKLSTKVKQSTDLGCTDSRIGKCPHGYGVPINQLDSCVQCDQNPSLPGWVMFILMQLLPVTVVVLIIIVFNIQLTNGYMIGVVFYCQMISVVYPSLSLNVAIDTNLYNYFYNYDCPINNTKWYIMPCNIFNLDFLTFLSHPLCITPHMTPLQAISFWYIIPTYPLVLLFLIYTWITMYDKGFRCVVTITRPLHRLLARFWRMTNIEPSLIHSIASIYLLCFTQIAATSLQLLYPTTWYYTEVQVKYFGWAHCFAVIFAIIVLVFIIFLPMLYIQLYPFKLFHKLLSCLHLRKEILISLGDIFTGSYNNGSDNTRDYRYFAGFYFVLRIIILCLYLIPYELIILGCQIALFGLFGGMIMIFRPHKNNLQNFSNLIIFLLLMTASGITLILWITNQSALDVHPENTSQGVIVIFSGFLVFCIFISAFVRTVKKIANICVYCRGTSNPSLIEEHADIQPLLENDDNWIADRIEHPDNYDEQHVQYAPYDLPVSQPQDITVHATYESISNPELTGTCKSNVNPLSTRDTRCTVAVSERLSISLHPIACKPDAKSITDNDDDIV